MILSVDGVEFSYSSRPVLRDIKFEANRGEFFSILGNNGVGKSTLLKCMNGILKPRRGTVFIEKKNILRLSRSEVAQRMGYVAQRCETARFTVFDAVLLGRKPFVKWDVSARDLEIVHRVLGMLGLEEFALRYLDELSGGELQKVVIARALAQQPRVLLLDEPTSNLDLKNQLEVLHIVKRSVREQNIAAVVVMHDLNLALRFSDKFLLLKERTIFACGGMEIMTPENITSVYGVPVIMEKLRDVPVVVPLFS
jgi:iron complex transport system ATP-binding protein